MLYNVMKSFKEQYEQFLEISSFKLSYEEWLELQLSNRRRGNGVRIGKKIEQLDRTNQVLIGSYNSITEAARLTGINRVLISKHLSNSEKVKHAGGYLWRFVE